LIAEAATRIGRGALKHPSIKSVGLAEIDGAAVISRANWGSTGALTICASRCDRRRVRIAHDIGPLT
jgi:hypothetical protein